MMKLMKKLMLFTLCAALALALAACGGKDGQAGSGSGSAAGSGSASQGSATIANPFTDCGTLDEAAQLAGFPLEAPDTVPGGSERQVRAAEGSMIEVIWSAEDGAEVLRARKGAGTGDVSGDYNNYGETATAVIGGLEATLKGDGGKVCLAVWTDGGHAFSLSAPAGLTAEEMSALVEAVK